MLQILLDREQSHEAERFSFIKASLLHWHFLAYFQVSSLPALRLGSRLLIRSVDSFREAQQPVC